MPSRVAGFVAPASRRQFCARARVQKIAGGTPALPNPNLDDEACDHRTDPSNRREKLRLAIFGYRQTRPLDIFLACHPVFGIVIQLLVHYPMGSARQRPRTRPAASTFPLLQGDLRARSDSN